jgi:hypothetical protein
MSDVANRRRAEAPWRSRVPWYQASYNYTANLLHLALDPEAETAASEEWAVLVQGTVALLLRGLAIEEEPDREAEVTRSLEASVIVEIDADAYLRAIAIRRWLMAMEAALRTAALVAGAKDEATALLRTTVGTIQFGRFTNIRHWWGVLPPGEEGRVLRRFLREEVEPTAAVLLAGALVEAGVEYSFEEVEAPSRAALERHLINSVQLSPAQLISYATEVVRKMEKPARGRVNLGWSRSMDTARAHYSFACFYSRVAARTRSSSVRTAALKRSVAELERVFPDEPRRDYRIELARWAPNDPSLAEVRSAPETRRRVEQLIQRALPDVPPRLEEAAPAEPAARAAPAATKRWASMT